MTEKQDQAVPALFKADNELVEEIKNGNKEAFNDLFSRYQRKIYSFLYYLTANQGTAEDLTQNAFLNAYKSIHSWTGAGSFKNWLYKIAHREALAFFKKQKRNLEVFTPEGELPEVADSAEDIDVQLANKEILEKALHQLPLTYRTVLLLRYFNELSYEEIAESTKLPLNTVRTHLRRAKISLEKELKKLI